MAYTIDGVEIPGVYSDEQPEDEIIGDEGRTADGSLRSDIIAVKRSWRLQTRPITLAEKDAILTPLRAALYAPVAYHHDNWTAGVTVAARVRVSTVRLLEPDGYWALSITILEV